MDLNYATSDLAFRDSVRSWSKVQQHIWEEECARAGTPAIMPFGVNMVAPVLIAFGSESQ